MKKSAKQHLKEIAFSQISVLPEKAHLKQQTAGVVDINNPQSIVKFVKSAKLGKIWDRI